MFQTRKVSQVWKQHGCINSVMCPCCYWQCLLLPDMVCCFPWRLSDLEFAYSYPYGKLLRLFECISIHKQRQGRGVRAAIWPLHFNTDRAFLNIFDTKSLPNHPEVQLWNWQRPKTYLEVICVQSPCLGVQNSQYMIWPCHLCSQNQEA